MSQGFTFLRVCRWEVLPLLWIWISTPTQLKWKTQCFRFIYCHVSTEKNCLFQLKNCNRCSETSIRFFLFICERTLHQLIKLFSQIKIFEQNILCTAFPCKLSPVYLWWYKEFLHFLCFFFVCIYCFWGSEVFSIRGI